MDPVHAGPARPQAGSGLSVEAPTLPAPADLRKPEDPLSAEPEDPLSAAPAPEPWPPAPQLAAAEPQPPPAARHTFLERRFGQAPQTTDRARSTPEGGPQEGRHDSRPPSAASRLISIWAAAWRGSRALRGEGAVCRRRLRLEASTRRLSSHRRLDSGAARRLRLAPPLDSRRPSVASRLRRPHVQRRGEQLCAGQRRGEAAVRWRHLSTRVVRPSPPVSVAA